MSMDITVRENTRARYRRRAVHFLLYLVLLTVATMCFFPFVAMLIGSTQDNLTITTTFTLIPGDRFVENYQRMILNKDIWGGFLNSVWLAVVNTALCLYFSALTGYAFSKFRFKGRNALFTFIMVVMMLFRPQGLISGERRRYRISALHGDGIRRSVLRNVRCLCGGSFACFWHG